MPKILTEDRTHLSQTLPGHQIFWDSTSIGAFLKCPRYYYYSMLCGYRPKDESIHLSFGSLYHAGLEHFDEMRVVGFSHDAAVEYMIWYILIRVEREGWGSEDPKKNKETLLRTLVWYTEEYKEDTFQTYILADGTAAVELSFRFNFPFHAESGEQYGLCGHFDKVAQDSLGNLYILDKKTSGGGITSYYFANYTPDVQMTLYSLAGQLVLEKPIAGVIVDAAQLAVGFSRFARGVVTRSKGSLEEFMGQLRTVFDLAEWYAKREEWPMQQTSCDKYGGCQFRGVCGADPSVREHFLRADFKVEPWNPLIER